MVVEIQVMAWEWHTNVAVLNWLMVYLHYLNNWISNDNTDINKQKNVKIFFHSKEISHFHKNEWRHKQGQYMYKSRVNERS
jgi:hypothetical protein